MSDKEYSALWSVHSKSLPTSVANTLFLVSSAMHWTSLASNIIVKNIAVAYIPLTAFFNMVMIVLVLICQNIAEKNEGVHAE